MPGLFDRLQSEIDRREPLEGLSPADLLLLPDDLRRVVQRIARRGGMTASALAGELGIDAPELARIAEALVEKGMIVPAEVDGEAGYKIRLARRRVREVPFNIWSALEERAQDPAEPAAADEGGGADEDGAADGGGAADS